MKDNVIDLQARRAPIEEPEPELNLWDKIVEQLTTWAAFAMVYILKSKYVRRWL